MPPGARRPWDQPHLLPPGGTGVVRETKKCEHTSGSNSKNRPNKADEWHEQYYHDYQEITVMIARKYISLVDRNYIEK